MIIELRSKYGVLLRMSIYTFLALYLKEEDLPILYRKDFKVIVDGKTIPKPKVFNEAKNI